MENIFNYLLSSPNVVDFSNESKKTKQPKLPQDILHDVLLYGPKMYKVYTIPKKNGGKRVIAHPSRGLKVVQRDLVVFLEKILPVHNSAYAYIKNRSIKDNAHYHSKNRYHLKMDLSNFFNSIDTELFFTQLDTNGVTFNSDEMYLLQRSLFWSPTKSEIGKLITSVGAPSSPLISNFIMNTYDFMISDICKSLEVKYSRYADDMFFSTNIKDILFTLPNIVDYILDTIYSGKLRVNSAKTKFSSKAHNRYITGLVITNDAKVSIGRSRKRLISSLVHKHQLGLLEPDSVSSLQGLLGFVRSVEPEFLDRLVKKYGDYEIQRIIKGLV